MYQVEPSVAVITGASSGIGKEAAKSLLKRGWTTICIGRNPERCSTAEAELQTHVSRDNQLIMYCADLASLASVKALADKIESQTDYIDALLNNAGGMAGGMQITIEGNEATFAGNYLGHFLLTSRLLHLLHSASTRRTPGATRIINVSSRAHESCTGLDWGNLQSTHNFSPGEAYCRVKLANILFSVELAKRLSGTGIIAHAMHPGVVASNFGSDADEATRSYLKSVTRESPESAADTLVWLASAHEPGHTTGKYYFQRMESVASKPAIDSSSAQRLWLESEKLIAD